MLRHAIVFVVIPVLLSALKIPLAPPLQDINRFIENLLQDEGIQNNGRDDRSQEVNKGRGYIPMSSRELDELINQAAYDVYSLDKNRNNDRTRDLKGSKNYKRGYTQDKYLQQLSSYSERKPRNPSIAFSHHEVNPIGLDSDNIQVFNYNDYKLYVIRNSQASLKEKNLRGVTDLISQILLGSTSEKILPKQDNTGTQKERRYKGFVIADGRRRRNRESKELYSPQDSLEDFKPKKVRNDYGGAGGRTPIPYIRHRDIYERE